jgi:ABC-type transporter Mla maintaining outer membrane lipid asymmetry ATPase subunit MlaF
MFPECVRQVSGSRPCGGQQRRLDLALGVIGDPELLFLDEPTTGFDPSARRQAWNVVRELCAVIPNAEAAPALTLRRRRHAPAA